MEKIVAELVMAAKELVGAFQTPPYPYSEDEMRKIAKEFLQKAKRITGWKTEGVRYSEHTRYPILDLIAPGWSKGTTADERTPFDEDAEASLDAFEKLTSVMHRRYPELKFNVAGGSFGPKLASMPRRKISNG